MSLQEHIELTKILSEFKNDKLRYYKDKIAKMLYTIVDKLKNNDDINTRDCMFLTKLKYFELLDILNCLNENGILDRTRDGISSYRWKVTQKGIDLLYPKEKTAHE